MNMHSSAGIQRAIPSDYSRLPRVVSNNQRPEADTDKSSVLVIHARALDRECFVQSLSAKDNHLVVSATESLGEWAAQKTRKQAFSAILLNIGSHKITELTVAESIEKAIKEFRPAPVIVIGDNDDIIQVLRVLELGARGYIPSSVGINVCVQAIDMALAGGVFVPASSVMAMRHHLETGHSKPPPLGGMFTDRQVAVIEALRRGKANKIIAHELNLRESTVKVHVRNIMKKLKATNRTEVACKINELFPVEDNWGGISGGSRNGSMRNS